MQSLYEQVRAAMAMLTTDKVRSPMVTFASNKRDVAEMADIRNIIFYNSKRNNTDMFCITPAGNKYKIVLLYNNANDPNKMCLVNATVIHTSPPAVEEIDHMSVFIFNNDVVAKISET